MITLISLSAMQVVTPSQVKFFSTMAIKSLLTVCLINNALKIIALIPPVLQPLQIIHLLLLIKDASTPPLTTFMKERMDAIPSSLCFKKAGTSITALTTCMTEIVGALTRLLDLLKPQLAIKENITTINYIDSTTCATAVKDVEEEGGITRPLKLQPTVEYMEEEGGLKSSTKEEELKTKLAITTNDTNEQPHTSTVTYRFNGFSMKLNPTQAILHTSPLDESSKRITESTLPDKPDFDNERKTRTQLELFFQRSSSCVRVFRLLSKSGLSDKVLSVMRLDDSSRGLVCKVA